MPSINRHFHGIPILQVKRKGVYQFLFIPYETDGCDLSVKPVDSFSTTSLDRGTEDSGTNNVTKSTGSKRIVRDNHGEGASNHKNIIDNHKITVDREQIGDNDHEFMDYRLRAETFSVSSDNSTTSFEDIDETLPNTDIPVMYSLDTTENMTFESNEENILDKIDKMMLHYLD